MDVISYLKNVLTISRTLRNIKDGVFDQITCISILIYIMIAYCLWKILKGSFHLAIYILIAAVVLTSLGFAFPTTLDDLKALIPELITFILRTIASFFNGMISG